MEKKYGLTAVEYEIMEYFWSQKNAVGFKEVLSYFNDVKGKTWKKQTLSTYIKILQSYGLIKADDSKKRLQYYSSCTREQHIHNWTVELCRTSFDNSICKLIYAFTGGKVLDDEDVRELKEYLKKYD